MRILITGGGGFIGSHLADRLIDRGDSVLAIDNFTTGRRDNLVPRDQLTLIEGSIADRDVVDAAFGDFRPELVIHAAAAYKDPEDWTNDALTNVVGTATVVRAAQEVGVKRIIYFQTALCYGVKPLEQPITLDHPLRPTDSSYAISKTAAEHYVRLSGLDHVSFRLANAYGPRNLSGPLPTFFMRLTAGKDCFVADTRRDFVFVDDIVDCVMGAVEGRGHGVYHVASGGDFAIRELYDGVVRALRLNLDRDVEVRARAEDDAYTILLDPSRTTEDFGWTPRTPLDQGIRRAVEYYKAAGVEETFTHLKAPND